MNRGRRCFRCANAVALACVFVGALATAPAAWGADSGKPAAPAANVPHSQLVDINHADIAELKTLPGIRQAYAEKIVRNRPYANKTQLESKGVIPVATYRKIRTLIIAKQ